MSKPAPHHSERKHSKFAASSAERWSNCPGSVNLSEGVPDKSSPWAIEGTRAHEVLEAALTGVARSITFPVPREMMTWAVYATGFIKKLHAKHEASELLVEERIPAPFIHEEAFGTVDSAVVEHFGWLHVLDYKFGKGHAVSPKENLQMIYYGVALAAKYQWNFQRVRLWIIQPRVRGFNAPLFWDVDMPTLKAYGLALRAAAIRAEEKPYEFKEGSWCHWCKAKGKCPLKLRGKSDKAKEMFK